MTPEQTMIAPPLCMIRKPKPCLYECRIITTMRCARDCADQWAARVGNQREIARLLSLKSPPQ